MNKVILMGRLTKNPELTVVKDNINVCKFTIAVDRKMQKETDFFNVTAWRNTAEFISKYFTKGQRILLEGNIQNREYTDKEGIKRYITEIIAENVYFADGKKDNNNNNINNNEFINDDDLPF